MKVLSATELTMKNNQLKWPILLVYFIIKKSMEMASRLTHRKYIYMQPC